MVFIVGVDLFKQLVIISIVLHLTFYTLLQSDQLSSLIQLHLQSLQRNFAYLMVIVMEQLMSFEEVIMVWLVIVCQLHQIPLKRLKFLWFNWIRANQSIS